ncbi:hypothetical protein FRB95_014787 [Tulasnella sp. JGI-2019a]|nr:hypothetical protein FRB95_014787 [Tulasnella sp. JGI-2019a]
MLRKAWSPFSLTQAFPSSEEVAIVAQDEERSRRWKEYVRRGRLHNQSISRKDYLDDEFDKEDNHVESEGACCHSDTLSSTQDPLTGCQTGSTELVKFNKARALVVAQIDQVHAAKTVDRTTEALRTVSIIIEKKTYKDGDQSIIRHNLSPLIVKSLGSWSPSARAPASQAIDLFAGQTIEFGRLLQVTLYHVAEGQLLCGEVIAILQSFFYEGGEPPVAKIQDLRHRISRQRRYSMEALKELDDLLGDFEWSKKNVSSLVATEHTSAKKERSLWQSVVANSSTVLCISALFTVGTSLAILSGQTSVHAEAKDIADIANKVLGGMGWVATGLSYQTKELEVDVQKKKSRGEMLAPALESIVDVGYCVKHYKNSFQTLESHFCIPFFTATDLDDGAVLDKWMAAEVLFQAFYNNMTMITKAMKDYRIELPLNPYGMENISRAH